MNIFTHARLDALERSLDVSFDDKSLLELAFVHSSFLAEFPEVYPESNERLEFLGDALVGLVVAHELYTRFPKRPEGQLTQMRATLVSKEALAQVADVLEMGGYLILGKGETETGGVERESNRANAFEALIGAVYLDSGFESARGFILNSCKIKFAEIVAEPIEKNPKGELQEALQKISQLSPTYRVLNQSGPDHNCSFETEVQWNGLVLGAGVGNNKKESERSAAQNALEQSIWLSNNPCE